ncbi:MAG: single-stranded DNA-binding protein [Eubacteriales bacterium]
MPSLNKVILMGNICRDPELKQTASGVSVCSFSIGVSRRYKGEDGKSVTDFPLIVCWRQTAEFVCRFFHKGDPILIVGQLQTRTYDDLQGKKRSFTEIVADEVGFAASKKSEADEEHKTENTQPNRTQPEVERAPDYSAAAFEALGEDDQLPF